MTRQLPDNYYNKEGRRRKEAQARYRAKVAADPVKNAARKQYMHDYGVKRYAEKKQMEAESLESWK